LRPWPLAPSRLEASEVGKLVDINVRTLEAIEFERRLAALEAKRGMT
jgi:hypothetical protein